MGELTILAVDPGGTTGLAWCPSVALLGKMDKRFAKMTDWAQIEGDVGEQAMKITHGVMRLDARVVVNETSDHFLLKGGKSLTKHSLVPIQLDGAMMLMVHALNEQNHNFRQRLLVEHTASMKSVITDVILQEYGFKWAKGKERHQADAMRHLILFIRRYKNSVREQGELSRQVDAVVNVAI